MDGTTIKIIKKNTQYLELSCGICQIRIFLISGVASHCSGWIIDRIWRWWWRRSSLQLSAERRPARIVEALKPDTIPFYVERLEPETTQIGINIVSHYISTFFHAIMMIDFSSCISRKLVKSLEVSILLLLAFWFEMVSWVWQLNEV